MQFMEGVWRSLTTEEVFPKQDTLGWKLMNQYGQASKYVKSYYLSRRNNNLFREVRTYCMFVGHPRTGGTLVGALLDAHPHAILADEVDALKYFSVGFTREQIYHLLLSTSQEQARRGKSKVGLERQRYSYQVPNQWQGRYERLLVIGDRKPWQSTKRLGRDPELLNKLRNTLGGIPIRVVHVIRNPYDTISTLNLRRKWPIPECIDKYFSNCAVLDHLHQSLSSSEFFSLRHEALLSSPEDHLKQLCSFLDLQANEAYLRDCASILFKNPSKSRSKVAWQPEWIETVKSRIADFGFLQEYSFSD